MVDNTIASSSERTRSIAYVALSIALLAVSAWVTVPFGPVPFTLQVFVLVFILVALEPKLALASIFGYVAIGAIGIPVFSAMRGGIGVLAGPTGGFIWGMLLGAVLAVGLARLAAPAGGRASGKPSLAVAVGMAVVMLLSMYFCGWVQLMLLLGIGPAEAFATGIAPFIVIDIAKIAAAVAVASGVKRALAS
jgi:biotin transport system substrate-specific component